VSLDLTVERQPGGFVVHRTLSYRVDRVPLAHYSEFRDACQRIDDAIGRRATVRMGGAQ
jgi:hypothetical protein